MEQLSASSGSQPLLLVAVDEEVPQIDWVQHRDRGGTERKEEEDHLYLKRYDIPLSELIDGEGKEEGDYGGHVDETVQQHHPVMFLPSAITSPLILFPAI